MEFKFLIGDDVIKAEQQLPVEQRVTWPLDSMVMYAFEGEQIVGRMGLMSIKLIEGTFIKPGASVDLPTLLLQMEAMLRYLGESHAMALVYDEQPAIGRYLRRLGFEHFPVTMVSKQLVAKEIEEAA